MNNTNSQNYALFFEKIDKNTSIEEYRVIFDDDIYFKDPFHEVKGIDNLYSIFEQMYIKLEDPSFKVAEIIEQNDIAYLKWSFYFSFKGRNKKEFFEGVSRVEFDKKGKVISHIDYWDSASNLYEKIPFLSFFIRFIKNKINS